MMAACAILLVAFSMSCEVFAGIHLRITAEHPRDHSSAIEGIHWLYTNPAVWESVFPMMTAFFICVNSSVWWAMAYHFYWLNPRDMPVESYNGDETIHYTLSILYTVFLVTLALLLAITLVAQYIDRNARRLSNVRYLSFLKIDEEDDQFNNTFGPISTAQDTMCAVEGGNQGNTDM